MASVEGRTAARALAGLVGVILSPENGRFPRESSLVSMIEKFNEFWRGCAQPGGECR